VNLRVSRGGRAGSDLMAHRVRGTEDGVGEREDGLQRGLRHEYPAWHVVRPLHRVHQVVGHHHHRPQRVMIGELVVPQRHEHLDAVRQRVQTRCGSELFGHRAEEPRVVSVTMQNCDTSAPVPDVDGTTTSGGSGIVALSTPS
jgi:hypothetical protein